MLTSGDTINSEQTGNTGENPTPTLPDRQPYTTTLWCRPALAMGAWQGGASSCPMSCPPPPVPLGDRLEPCLAPEQGDAAALPKVHRSQNKQDLEAKDTHCRPLSKKSLSLPVKRNPREMRRTRHFGALIFLTALDDPEQTEARTPWRWQTRR